MISKARKIYKNDTRPFFYKKWGLSILFFVFLFLGIIGISGKAHAIIICAIPPWHANDFQTCPQDHDPWYDPPPVAPSGPGGCVFVGWHMGDDPFFRRERCPMDPDCTLCHQAGMDAFHESFLERIFSWLWKLREWHERRDEWFDNLSASSSHSCDGSAVDLSEDTEAAITISCNNRHDNTIGFTRFNAFWTDFLREAFHQMTEQFTATAFTQVSFIGSFFDAQHQLERQAVLDQYHLQAIKDYQPSTALCRFGTATRPLASSEQLSKINKQLIFKRLLKRQLANTGSVGHSTSNDLSSRLVQFKNNYCNPDHLNGELTGEEEKDPICGQNGASDPARYDKDINVTKTLLAPDTLDINFADTSLTQDEEDILALSANLYGYEIIQPPKDMGDLDERGKEAQRFYHRYRSLLAKRKVAENSFSTLVGLKSKGSGAATDYLVEIMEGLGYSDNDELEEILTDAPSYDAQMNILTKKIYQNPTFISSLIDKPENIKRQQASMLAIELMQRRETYKSALRQEMIIAVLLELFLDDRFEEVKGQIDELVYQ